MGQSQRQKALAGALIGLLLAGTAWGQNPFGLLSRAVTTTMDARTKAEVTADTEIGAGAVKTDAVKKRVEELVKQDKRFRSFKNELQVGDVGSLARDTALEAEINAKLTAAKGISSVNMRWCATGGRVVLMGVAQSQQEADAALRIVRPVKGVKLLVSHLRVVSPKK